MTQADNDLEQLEKARRDVANVYKTQALDEIIDNGNLSVLNEVILGLNNAIATLKKRSEE